MISIPGSLSFVMSSAPTKKSAADARCQDDPSIESPLPAHTISTPIRFTSAFFLSRSAMEGGAMNTYLRVLKEIKWILSFYQNLLSISHTTFRHCRVRFYAFFGQPLSKQLYNEFTQ